MNFSEWKPVEGFFNCLANPEPHYHPGSHDETHRMSNPRKNNPLERYCLGRDCNYLERRSFE